MVSTIKAIIRHFEMVLNILDGKIDLLKLYFEQESDRVNGLDNTLKTTSPVFYVFTLSLEPQTMVQ